jgi:hypothetical protein
VNPYLFIVGCLRSGLTLLTRILSAHSQLAITPDISWITDYFKPGTRILAKGSVTADLVTKWFQRKLFDPFGFSREEIPPSPGQSVSLESFLTQLFELCSRINGKGLVGSLAPIYVRRIRALHTLWPGAKFIHLIRDGRDVCLSALSRPPAVFAGRSTVWAEDCVSAAALWWERDMRLGRQGGRELGPELYHEVRYEALVAQPEPECVKLCAFLGVPYEPSMLRFHEGLTGCHGCDSLGTGTDNAWRPITPGLRDWSTQMAAGDIKRFEAAAGGVLDELGYSRAAPCPSPAEVEHATHARHLFAQQFGARKTSLQTLVRQRGDARPNPFLFIVGCPRSGTTLLKRVVDAHSQIAVMGETDWIAKYFETRTGLTPDGLVTPELIPRLFEHTRFYTFKIGPEELEELLSSGEPISYRQLVSGFFDAYGEETRKVLVGDKTPDYILKMHTLHTLWPAAKFVHLIRDGRDVCLSLIDWKRKAAKLAKRYPTWVDQPVATAAKFWERHVRFGRETGRELGPGLYHEVRYEALVAKPEQECASLCTFLGVPYEPAMLRFYEGRTRAEPGLDAKDAWRPITPGLRDWRTQMTALDVERFEAAGGHLLEELGYPRAVPQPGAEALEQAARIREVFVRDAPARSSVLSQCS